ncbi:MAG: FMN-binding glutamate synthase family protein [Sulfobacillus sp.]|nr:FMN-binding glutamate synthase family protein [Sulfobacillus sp.]
MMFWVILGAGLIVLTLAGILVWWSIPWLSRRMIHHLLTRPMSDTWAELYLSMRSTPPVDFLYSSLRANTGDKVIRPMGSARPAHGLDDLAFVPAQLARRPVLETEPVELAVTLGRRRPRPLTFSMPLFLSGMAYGLALTKEARLALATASGEARIPLNSGQGPFLTEERALAYRYILQFGRWDWNRDPDILRQADMIEIQVGQGAMPGNAVIATPGEVGPEIKRLMRLGPDQAPIIHADLYLTRPDEPAALRDVVDYLRQIHPEVPIALKMGAGNELERDLDVALDAGVDVIVIDGTEGATGNAPITLSDHFGIPSLMALVRAERHLRITHTRDDVDLVISGGFREPGDFLKAYALGADAVGIGTIAMFALAHYQITEAVPLYPPTDLVFYRAHPRIPLDVEKAARGLSNFLESCRTEMTIAIRTMGHTSVHQLTPEDLSSLDPEIARITGVRYAGHPWAHQSPATPGQKPSEKALHGIRKASGLHRVR